MANGSQRSFWRSTRRLTSMLLVLWLAVSVAVPWFARDLAGRHGFGFPLGYWLAAEGALMVYLAIIVACVVGMDRHEAAYLDAGDDAPEQG